MQILHRVSASSDPKARRQLADIGLTVEADDGPLISFEIHETHKAWPQIARWIEEHQAVDIISTKFSAQEIAAAEWLELVPDWHHGYPQPRADSFGYLGATYDLTGYCPECGAGLRQNAPFQMKAEPKWGRRSIMQLNWVFDVFFVKPEVWAAVFEPHGIGKQEVLNTQQAALKTVVQLVVDQEGNIATDGLAAERCAACGREKYEPMTRGPAPALTGRPQGHMIRSAQLFGSGASARRLVAISQTVARAFEVQGIRGASLRPLTPGLSEEG